MIIHAGATVLGAITVGQGAVIGGNAWVTEDVATGTELLQASTKAQWHLNVRSACQEGATAASFDACR